MSRSVDFIATNFNNLTKILRPETKTDLKSKNNTHSTIKIQKSFQPQHKSSINEALRPEIDKLKEIYKRKLEEEKKMKALLAQGKISRDDLQKPEEKPKKQEAAEPDEKVTIDESGQVRDEQGNLLFIKNRTTELLINRKKEEAVQIKNLAKKQRIKVHQKLSRSLLDRNLIVGTSRRRIRRSMLGLQFLEKGSYQPSELKQQQLKQELQNLNDVFAQQQFQETFNPIKKRSKVNLQFNRDIPEVQWWDSALINNQTYDQMITLPQEFSFQDKIQAFSMVQWANHINFDEIGNDTTFQKVSSVEDQKNIILPMFLTKEERKKLKRKRKHQKLLEKNDKIKLGLVQPDKPKLRVGNMAIVMKNQFIVDPSKIEAQAKKQTQERIDKHNESNSMRKLSKSQKKDKALRKLKRDSAKQCRRAVFKVNKLVDPTQAFKVNMNAKQLALNGFIIKPSNQFARFPTMVLIEGGIRAVKFYKNLMLKRINWTQNDDMTNGCSLIWQGQIEGSTAGKWKVYEVGDEVEGIRLLTQKKLQNFWEYISNN